MADKGLEELSKRVDALSSWMTEAEQSRARADVQNAREHRELADKIDGVVARVDRSSSEIRTHIDNVMRPTLNRKPVFIQVLKWCGEHPRLALSFMACLMLIIGAVSVGDIGTLMGSFFSPAGPG